MNGRSVYQLIERVCIIGAAISLLLIVTSLVMELPFELRISFDWGIISSLFSFFGVAFMPIALEGVTLWQLGTGRSNPRSAIPVIAALTTGTCILIACSYTPLYEDVFSFFWQLIFHNAGTSCSPALYPQLSLALSLIGFCLAAICARALHAATSPR